MNHTINEPLGFKMSLLGFATWFASLLQGVDLTQMLGFVALVVGVFIQIVSFYRNKKADQRDKEADDRAKIKHNLEMQVLARELQHIESSMENGNQKTN